jgi:hypothetical protein
MSFEPIGPLKRVILDDGSSGGIYDNRNQLIIPPRADEGSLAASSGSSLVGHIASGAGAVARTVQSKARDIVSVFDFLTDAQRADVTAKTRTLSVATEMAACLSAVQAAGGGAVWMPPGAYLAPTINTASGNSVRIIGSGNQNTVIWTNSATASILDLAAWNSSIEHVGFNSSVTRTAGNYVTLTGAFTSAVHCEFRNDFTGVYMIGVNAKVLHCVFRNGAENGSRIVVDGGDTTQLIHGTLMAAQLAPFPFAGIRVKNSSALTISDTSIIAQGNDLLINPASGEFCFSLYASNCFFDTATRGVYIIPSGTGVVQRLEFVNCWATSHTGDGFRVLKSGSFDITGVHLLNCQIHLNGGNGVNLASSGISDFRMLGGRASQNASNGIYIENGVGNFSICGVTAGASDGLSGNTGRGIAILGTSHDNYTVTGNITQGNTLGQILDQGTGTTKSVRDNLGYNPIAPAAVSVGASPFTYTNNTGETAVLVIYGGTVSSVTLNGRTVATATGCAVTVPHGRSVVITHSSAPSAEVMGF